MGSIRPDGDKCGNAMGVENCTMFIEGEKIVFEFDDRITGFSLPLEGAEMLHYHLGEAIEVLRNEIQTNRQFSESSTDNKGE